MIITDLTYKMIAYTAIKEFNTDECIDWALELVELGCESHNLLILAGLSKPTNYFETIDYLEKSFKELSIVPKENEDAIISYCFFYINEMSKGLHLKRNLALIYKFCMDHGYDKNVYDFYLLHWAWDDFMYGDDTHYWDGATKENIEDIVIKTSIDWIKEFKDLIKIKN